MIIKFYDKEGYQYPLLEIEDEDFNKIKNILKEYQKDGGYSWEDFVLLLHKKVILIKEIVFDEELYF